MTEKTRIPHDPLTPDHVGLVGPGARARDAAHPACPDCDEPWPCAERKRQRTEKRAMQRLLDSAFYEPQRERVQIDGVEAIRWQSPVRWYADLTYGERGVIVVVHTPDGEVRSDDATVEWLDGVLP